LTLIFSLFGVRLLDGAFLILISGFGSNNKAASSHRTPSFLNLVDWELPAEFTGS
jgi:hypothetical protein